MESPIKKPKTPKKQTREAVLDDAVNKLFRRKPGQPGELLGGQSMEVAVVAVLLASRVVRKVSKIPPAVFKRMERDVAKLKFD